MTLIEKKFGSPRAYLDWATDEPSPWKGELQSRSGTYDFTSTRSYDEAYDLARYGWREGLNKLQNASRFAAAVSPPQAPAPARRFDVAGTYPHVPRAAAGEIFSMVSRQPPVDRDRTPIVRMEILQGYPCFMETGDIINWGACLVSAIDALEMTGKSVELTMKKEISASGGPSLSFSFPLKKAGSPLSLSDLVFWLAHPSANRRIGFAATEKLDVEEYYSDGYGLSEFVTPHPAGVARFAMKEDNKGSFEANMEHIMDKIQRECHLSTPVPQAASMLRP
jgi:hypothetical protein